MQAVLILPDDALFLANFVDRPFLRHVVEFIVAQGIWEIVVVGPGTERARKVLGDGHPWDATIVYHEVRTASDFERIPIVTGNKCLLAVANCLPSFRLTPQSQQSSGMIVYGKDDWQWTGWALLEPRDISSMPPLSDRAAVLSYLESLPDYARVSAELEFRCGNAEDIWRSHQTALDSSLSTIFHVGLEVSPGVWIARNASVAATAEITSPVYIGENTRIGPGAQIGPHAVIAKDCLIAPRTIVRHSVIAPGTYAGNNLELDHVLINHRELFDIRLGVTLNEVGFPIIDSVFDFHWSAIPRQIYSALSSGAVAFFSALPWARKVKQPHPSLAAPAEKEEPVAAVPFREQSRAARASGSGKGIQ